MTRRVFDAIALAVALAAVPALAAGAWGGVEPLGPPAPRVKLDEVEVVVLTRAVAAKAVWALPDACRGRCTPFVLVVVAGRVDHCHGYEGDGESVSCLYTDRYGEMSEWEIRAWARWCYPGRDIVLAIVRVEPDEEGPPPECL